MSTRREPNYDESKVGNYVLLGPLRFQDGSRVLDDAAWQRWMDSADKHFGRPDGTHYRQTADMS